MSKLLLIAGATRSGTSYFHSELNNVDGISLSKQKELYYLNDLANIAAGKLKYEKLCNKSESNYYFGESTPTYMALDSWYYKKKPIGCRKINRFDILNDWFPEKKIILCLREPKERFLSIFFKNRNLGKKRYQCSLPDYLNSNHLQEVMWKFNYSSNLERIKESVPEEQLLILKYERDLHRYSDKLSKFLDLPVKLTENKRNTGKHYANTQRFRRSNFFKRKYYGSDELSSADHQLLSDILRDEIRYFQNLDI